MSVAAWIASILGGVLALIVALYTAHRKGKEAERKTATLERKADQGIVAHEIQEAAIEQQTIDIRADETAEAEHRELGEKMKRLRQYTPTGADAERLRIEIEAMKKRLAADRAKRGSR